MKYKGLVYKRIAAAVILAAIIIICVLLYISDPVNRPFYECPYYAYAGIYCPTCGFTRMAHSLLHLKIADAFHYHPIFALLAPPLAYLYLAATLNALLAKKVLPLPRFKFIYIILPLCILIAFTLLRNLIPSLAP